MIPERMTEDEVKKYAMFNARIETVERSRAFAQPFRSRRAVIPISCFFEWPILQTGVKTKVRIARPDGLPLLAAGLWNCTEDGTASCTVMTRPAPAELDGAHDRAPALLLTRDLEAWLYGAPAQAKRAAASSWQPGLLTVLPA
ncbi:SOS response-associated peptidase family protein [Deinococcus sp. KNUC1210]|uniref:SOS response-associated peptidase family protein n=1 Tax=Deinococcus sp. KNUC1210 TaxID=2917691 RepID=UPI002102DA44|nr:SOS response-associated peptidase family protein [Deinococcus sp. KNUC1210]